MRWLLPLLCLCALLCSCGKKSRLTSGDSNTPNGAAVVQIPALISPPRPVLPAGWVEFQHPDGAYTMYLPTFPRPAKAGGGTSLRQQVPAGRMLMSDFKGQIPGLFFEVGVSIFSPELVEGVKAAREKRGPVIYGPNVKRTPITWCGHPAFEDISEDPETHRVSIQRSMWIGNHLYYCSLYGQDVGRPTAEERTNFFDSFSPKT